MKSPDEIKKGLFCCWEDGCATCPYDDDCTMEANFEQLAKDALAYIQQLEETIGSMGHLNETMHNEAKKGIQELESRLAQVERERDAAVRAITDAQHYIKNLGAVQYGLQQLEKWDYYIKQRGVCAENTKVDADENTEKA